MNRAEKEIFIIEFYIDEEDEDGGYIIVQYEKDLGLSSGEEGSYSAEECYDEFPYIESLDFFKVESKIVSELYNSEFWYQLEVLGLK